MRLAAVVHYAVSDLRHRLGATALNVVAVALAAGYVLVLGFYGASIHRYQGELLARTLPTKVAASAPDVSDVSMRFSEERMAAIEAGADVALVFPRVELNVEVSLEGDRAMNVPAEGTVPGDPALAAERLAWGPGVSAPDAREVVLSRALYGRLGGLLAPTPSHERLVLQVSRTTGGREEVQRLELIVVGVLEHAAADKVHVPVELLNEIDLWCTSKIAALGESGERRLARYDGALAYGPAGSDERVAAEAEALQVEVEPSGTVEVFEARGPLWSVLERSDGAPLTAGDRLAARAALAGRALHEVRVGSLAGARLLALGGTDPRWDLLGVDVRAGTRSLIALNRDVPPGALGHAGPVVDPPRQFPVDADLAGDEDTYRRLFFDPLLSDGVERFTLVETRDPAAGAALGALRGAAPEAGTEFAWAFHGSPGPGRFRGALELGAAASGIGGLATGAWFEESFQALPDDAVRERRYRMRVLPRGFYRRLAPEEPLAGLSGTCVYVTRNPASAPTRLLIGREQVLVAGVLERPVSEDEVWMTRSQDLAQGDVLARMAGVVAWGPWSAVAGLDARDGGLEWAREDVVSNVPRVFAALLDGDPARAAERLPSVLRERFALTELVGVRARMGHEGLVLVGASQSDLQLADGRIALRGDPGVRGAAVSVATASWSAPALMASPQALYPPRLALVADAVFREAAYGSTTRAQELPGEPRLDLFLEDTLDLFAVERDLAPLGLAPRPLVPIEARTLQRWAVADPTSDDGRVGADLLAVLSMSQPTFLAARPVLATDARLEGVGDALALAASAAADPDRFAHVPLHGTWLRREKGPDQVVLPLAVLGDDPDPGAVIGRTVQARFGRRIAGTSEEGLFVPLEVVGIIDGDGGFVPGELLANVGLWRDGKLVFNETRGTFESPAEVTLRSGFLRANVFATDPGSVGAVVASLQGLGYHTEDRLAEQESLRRLGKILVFVVGFFVLGCVLNASITVLVATMMNVKSKIFEIGILRAHGVKVREVVGIFASQGLAIGVLAFAAAALVVGVGEPLLRGPVRQVFGLEGGAVLVGSPFDGALWWLGATALGISVLFSFGGVVVPAAFACRLSPVEALRRRE